MSSRPEISTTRILIGYASAYGSTKGVVMKIGEHLSIAGFEVDVRPIDEVESIDGYGAAIIGSAIHNQK